MTIEKERKNHAKKLFKLPIGEWQACDIANMVHRPPGLTRAFMNNRYVVMIYDDVKTTHGAAIRVMVQKHDNTPITFHWREMFKINNELFGAETVAVEYYPALSKLVDTHNIYWMFIYPEGVLPKPI